MCSLHAMKTGTIELLTHDHPHAATTLARLGIPSRGGLLPDERLAAVQAYERDNLTVAKIRDGINDVPALATAAEGIAANSERVMRGPPRTRHRRRERGASM